MRFVSGIQRAIWMAVATLLAAGTLAAVDWPQWRGERRDGMSPETGLLKQWPAGGPKVVWKTTGLGEGYSAFAIAKGKLFTQGQRGSEQFVMAFDVATTTTFNASTGGSYKVVGGDYLGGIAKKTGATVDGIVAANGWADGAGHVIIPGQTIKLPAKTG